MEDEINKGTSIMSTRLKGFDWAIYGLQGREHVGDEEAGRDGFGNGLILWEADTSRVERKSCI